jgi:hypothetical protein
MRVMVPGTHPTDSYSSTTIPSAAAGKSTQLHSMRLLRRIWRALPIVECTDTLRGARLSRNVGLAIVVLSLPDSRGVLLNKSHSLNHPARFSAPMDQAKSGCRSVDSGRDVNVSSCERSLLRLLPWPGRPLQRNGRFSQRSSKAPYAAKTPLQPHGPRSKLQGLWFSLFPYKCRFDPKRGSSPARCRGLSIRRFLSLLSGSFWIHGLPSRCERSLWEISNQLDICSSKRPGKRKSRKGLS